MNVLILAAHPDDEVLGVGGTAAGHVRRGDAVHAVVMSEGATSRYGDPMRRTLEAAGRRAAAALGLASIRFEGLPDQRMETVPLIEVTQRIEAVVEELAPSVVYTHFPGDVNRDHAVVARAAWTACRPYRFPDIRRFAVFETPSSTEWGWPLPGGAFQPNLYLDVSRDLDRKLEALKCYESELRCDPHPRSASAIRQRAAFWGSHVGAAAAEPFMILREIAS